MKTIYESPTIDLVLLLSEKGFAASDPNRLPGTTWGDEEEW